MQRAARPEKQAGHGSRESTRRVEGGLPRPFTATPGAGDDNFRATLPPIEGAWPPKLDEGTPGEGGTDDGVRRPRTQRTDGAQDLGRVDRAADVRKSQRGRPTRDNHPRWRSFLQAEEDDDSITGTAATTTSESGAMDMNTSLVLGASTVIVVLGLYLCRRQLRSWFCPKRAVPLFPATSDAKAQSYGSLSAMEKV